MADNENKKNCMIFSVKCYSSFNEEKHFEFGNKNGYENMW